MVKGIDIFRDFFKDYNSHFILIGGAACHLWADNLGIDFRTTKDLDIVIVVEKLSKDFVRHFWDFVKNGGYSNKQKSINRKNYYRFHSPSNKNYPYMLELFSRKPDILEISKNQNLIPLPVNDDLSSLSAILMNDDYYNLILEQRTIINKIPTLSHLALICLKSQAYIDLTKMKKEGKKVDSHDIKKHKNDVFRLAFTLVPENRIELPELIKQNIKLFISKMEKNPPDVKQLAKEMGLPPMKFENILQSLKESFNLKD